VTRPGARRGDPDQLPDRLPPPVPRAPAASPARTPTGRRPNGPADDETAPGYRTRPGPRRSRMPLRRRGSRAGRLLATSAGSPVGSAAASDSSRRVWAEARRRPPEAFFDGARQRYRAGEPEPAGQFRRAQSPRQLQQGQRVTPRLGEDLVPDTPVDRPSQHRIQQRPRRPRASPGPPFLAAHRSPPGRRAAKIMPNRFRPQVAGDEREELRRCGSRDSRRWPHGPARGRTSGPDIGT
jgi:hypothetical protein